MDNQNDYRPIVQIAVDPSLFYCPDAREKLQRAFQMESPHFGLDPAIEAGWIELIAGLTRQQAIDFQPAFGPLSAEMAAILTPLEKAERESVFEVFFRDSRNIEQKAANIRQVRVVQHAAQRAAVMPPCELPEAGDPMISDPMIGDPMTGVDDQDPLKQWYLFRCGADRAWPYATGRGVVIADIDWGCLISHDDLTNVDRRYVYNAFDGSSDVSCGDRISHGTSVAGLASAARNGKGIVGLAYDSAFWPIQANCGNGTALPGNAWDRGLDFILSAPDQRRKVVLFENQTSLGRNIESLPSHNMAIRQAIAHELIVVVPAGNGGADAAMDDDDQYIPETGSILVGATEFHPRDNILGGFSNYGSRVTVCAPGDMKADLTCTSTSPQAYRTNFGGTSGSSPKVAAACALLLEIDPTLSHADIKEILNLSGRELTSPLNREAGRFLDVFAAVQMARYGA